MRKVESRKCEIATVRKARLQGRFNQKAAGMKVRGEKDGEEAPRIKWDGEDSKAKTEFADGL